MTQTELKQILEQHALWLETGGEKGTRADLRDANLRDAKLLGADLRDADLRGANMYRADMYGAYLRGADMYGANLYGTYLRGANLQGADLLGANLRWANLREANMYGANMQGANMQGADTYGTNIYTFQLTRHFGYYHEGYVRIGCEGHSLSYWLRNYKKIAKEHGYSKTEIKAYSLTLKMLAKSYGAKLGKQYKDID